MTSIELNLTPTEALGVALSVAAPDMLMGDAQEAAPGMLAHLSAMGFTLDAARSEPVAPAGLREALRNGAIPAMRFAARRLRRLGDERTATDLDTDAAKIDAALADPAPGGEDGTVAAFAAHEWHEGCCVRDIVAERQAE